MRVTISHPEEGKANLRTEGFLYLSILALTILVRLIIFQKLRLDPIFLMPVVDSLEYDIWAYEILHKSFLWTELQYHTPLYPYFLALVYKIFGYNVSAVANLQYLLAGVSNIFVYLIAKKLVNKTAALISVFFMISYWFLIYTQSFIFCENLALFFIVLTIYVLICLDDHWKKFLVAGLLFGACVISRPDIILFSFFLLPWLLAKKSSRIQKVKYYLCFLLGIFAVLAPVTLRNYIISKELVFLRTQVAITAYIGNLPEYKGTAAIEIGKPNEDITSLPAKFHQRDVTSAEYEEYFIKKTLDILRHRPFEWMKLMAGKIFSVWTGRDFLRTEDVYFYNRYVLTTPFKVITTSMIFILAVPGIFLTYLADKRKFLLLYLVILSVMFLLFFQLKTRYFVPIFPFLIILASFTLYSFYDALKNKKYKKVFLIFAAICVLQTLSFANPLDIEPPSEAEAFYAIAKNYDSRNMQENAITYYVHALEINPKLISAYNDLGVLYLNRGDCAKAMPYFEEALRLDPDALRPKLNFQICREHAATDKQP